VELCFYSPIRHHGVGSDSFTVFALHLFTACWHCLTLIRNGICQQTAPLALSSLYVDLVIAFLIFLWQGVKWRRNPGYVTLLTDHYQTYIQYILAALSVYVTTIFEPQNLVRQNRCSWKEQWKLGNRYLWDNNRNSQPSSVEIKNSWNATTSSPYIFSPWYLIRRIT